MEYKEKIVIGKIKKRLDWFLASKERKIVIENYVSLSFVQCANYIMPLITMPYLIRILGIDGFGLYSFVYAFIQYFIVLTDYGFNLTATREVSIKRDDKMALCEIFTSVMIVKLLLFLLSLGVVLSLVLVVDKFKFFRNIYLYSTLSIFGNFLFPIWYLQGLEKTKYMAAINFLSRLVATICIFIFIKSPEDIMLTIIIQSGGVVLSGFLGLIAIAVFWPVNIIKVSVRSIKNTISNGWNVFVTIMSSTLVNNTNIFILGVFANNNSVGYFSVAEKIVKVFVYLAAPINSAIFPRVSKLYNESKEKGNNYLSKIIKFGTVGFIVAVLALAVLSDQLIKIVAGYHSEHIKTLVWIMAILPMTIFWDNMYGSQALINLGRTSDFMRAVLIPGIVSLALSLIFVPVFKEYATAIIFLLSELFILVMMVYYARRSGIYLVKKGVL